VKFKEVKLSEIAKHPNKSLSPKDYIEEKLSFGGEGRTLAQKFRDGDYTMNEDTLERLKGEFFANPNDFTIGVDFSINTDETFVSVSKVEEGVRKCFSLDELIKYINALAGGFARANGKNGLYPYQIALLKKMMEQNNNDKVMDLEKHEKYVKKLRTRVRKERNAGVLFQLKKELDDAEYTLKELKRNRR
jgi:hypothetical protein